MCGIAGTYALSESHSNASALEEALRRIAHRGPDDSGTLLRGRAGLGHRRLSVIDTTSAGHQPFTDADGRHTIIFNGEVFNFQELRARLEAQGHSFRSRTDTEVVLRLYTEMGPAFLHELNGFFALAIHDAHTDRLLLARDRFGVKPLLWSATGGRLLFASELRALLALGAPRTVDRTSLRQLFTYHYIAAPHTILEDVYKLPPGHLLHAGPDGLREERWYHLPDAARATPAAADPAAHLHHLLDDAVRLRLIADVPTGTFLSGGLDSSIVSALAARHHRDLHTFSIGYADDPWFDETRHAEAVARHIGSRHHTFTLTAADLDEGCMGLLDAMDEPFADSSALPSYLLCQRTRKHVTVALSGDGADEVFGGYRKHQAELRMRAPGVAERAVAALGPLWQTLPRSRANPAADLFRRLHRYAQAATGSEAARWLRMASFDTDGDAPRLVPGTDLGPREHELVSGLRDMPGMNGYLLADVRTVLANDMLYKVDLTSMAHALEVRTPFLDRRVVEFAFALPAGAKFGRGRGKQLLRETFGGLLPPGITARAKRGFEVPIARLVRGPLRPLMDELLRRDVPQEAGLDPAVVRAVAQRALGDKPGQAEATAFAVIVYLVWWRRWIGGD